jgi:hypothetical protein
MPSFFATAVQCMSQMGGQRMELGAFGFAGEVFKPAQNCGMDLLRSLCEPAIAVRMMVRRL